MLSSADLMLAHIILLLVEGTCSCMYQQLTKPELQRTRSELMDNFQTLLGVGCLRLTGDKASGALYSKDL